MDDFFRANFATLKGSEAKLLFTLRELGLDQVSKAELMRLSGVTHRNTFYDAWHKLERDGWLDWLRSGTKTELHLVRKPYSEYENRTDPGTKTEPSRSETVPYQYENRTEDSTKTVLDGTKTVLSMDFEKALALADEMDADGDDRNPHSPFQARRKQQLVLLEQVWADMFGEPLPPLTAKELLIAAKSQALDVYHAMQQAADYKAKYPRSYVRRTLENVAKKAPAAESEMKPVTEEMRQSWERNEALLKSSGWAWALED